MNQIIIRGLSVEVFIGVPDEERATAQKLLIDVIMEPLTPFDDLQEDLSLTVDYDAVSRMVATVATERPRRLIETLAAELTTMLITEFPARHATVEIRKFILPNVEYVAVRHTRQR